jgi:selenocysteine lyase/cysteine desulfurase
MTGVETATFTIAKSKRVLKQQLEAQIDGKTKVLMVSHVLKETGRELPISQLCRLAREIKARKNPYDPDLFIVVDGAQALGNVPRVDFHALGCDAYVATPHKTMRAGGVVGLLYFDPDNPKIARNLRRFNRLRSRDEQVILNGMFHPDWGIPANVADSLSYADLAGFSAAIDVLKTLGLKDNDFSKIYHARQHLKQHFVRRLKTMNRQFHLGIEFPTVDRPTPFIFSFRLPGRDGKIIAQRLSEHGVFLSYLDGGNPGANYFRVSFQPDSTVQELDKALEILKGVLLGR